MISLNYHVKQIQKIYLLFSTEYRSLQLTPLFQRISLQVMNWQLVVALPKISLPVCPSQEFPSGVVCIAGLVGVSPLSFRLFLRIFGG